MKTTTIWRVEDEKGRGPYSRRPGPVPGWRTDLYNAHNSLVRYPVPRYDGILDMTVKEVCGFASHESMMDWFGAYWIDVLSSKGYRVVRYAVPGHRVRYGEHQVVFDRGRSKPRS